MIGNGTSEQMKFEETNTIESGKIELNRLLGANLHLITWTTVQKGKWDAANIFETLSVDKEEIFHGVYPISRADNEIWWFQWMDGLHKRQGRIFN